MLQILYQNSSYLGALGLFLASVLLALVRFSKSFTWSTRKELTKRRHFDQEIKPLWGFDFRKTDPINYQPYKTQGHITMGIQKRTRSDWIRMDRGYLARIQERLALIKNKPEFTIGTGEKVNLAIQELYEEIMVRYLPARYPTMFQARGNVVENLATGTTYPLTTTELTHAQMLTYMGENVEEDFYFMCPDPDDQYRLQGYIAVSAEDAFPEKKTDPSLDECFLRVEHQTLTKLPRTSAIIFTVRSYMTSLHQVKAEGDGKALAQAIKSMPEGLGHYKMRQYWGTKILPWLMENI
ncbi:hypothetical protein F4823DRAFT_561405 [Ustulina deusta]|nr:hypothetical protein F4823DRAFT_561405 [Ustulina deusta]